MTRTERLRILEVASYARRHPYQLGREADVEFDPYMAGQVGPLMFMYTISLKGSVFQHHATFARNDRDYIDLDDLRSVCQVLEIVGITENVEVKIEKGIVGVTAPFCEHSTLGAGSN